MSPNRREHRFYKKAKLASQRSTHYKAHIGAVLVIGNYVVSEGCSREKSHTKQHRYDRKMNYHGEQSKLHAEIDALIASGRTDLTGADVFIYREDKKGNLANCRPCVSCAQALKDAGVRHVYYTNKDGFAYEQFG